MKFEDIKKGDRFRLDNFGDVSSFDYYLIAVNLDTSEECWHFDYYLDHTPSNNRAGIYLIRNNTGKMKKMFRHPSITEMLEL